VSNLKQEMLKKIEKYINFLINVLKDTANITKNQPNKSYTSDISNIGYEYFMFSGDKNYFVSRFFLTEFMIIVFLCLAMY